MDAAVLQRATVGRLTALLILGALPLMSHAADCPPLLDSALPTLTDDKPASICQYKGKVILAVNTASECGYTPQYEGLEKLYKRYKDKGLVVLGFPSNDFGGQEPGSKKEIAKFCEANYGVSFPMFDKSNVAKGGVNPFYARLAKATGTAPGWNFHKYLVDRSGTKVQSFATKVDPSDSKLVAEIEKLLAEKGDSK
jgi:glutathione peroxidase